MAVRHPKRIALANCPTPLTRLERLGAELGAEIWLKRDDLAGIEFSGNKIRGLEYIAADTLYSGCDTLLTEGTSQSNQCRTAAAVCAKLGLRCHLLYRPAPPEGPPQGNHLLDVLYEAETSSFSREYYDENRDQIVAETMDRLRAAGRKPRFSPTGGAEPLGCWGYIRCAAELADQLHAAGVGDCDIVLTISSGGTYAGMLLGQWIHQLHHWSIWAVSVSDDVIFHTKNIETLARSAIEEFDLPTEYDENGLQFIDGYVGEGYAIPYDAAIEALRLLARTEAIMLDPVYTAKAFCALLDGVREGRLGVRRPVVFLHTGGIFSDFAWPELLAGK